MSFGCSVHAASHYVLFTSVSCSEQYEAAAKLVCSLVSCGSSGQFPQFHRFLAGGSVGYLVATRGARDMAEVLTGRHG